MPHENKCYILKDKTQYCNKYDDDNDDAIHNEDYIQSITEIG